MLLCVFLITFLYHLKHGFEENNLLGGKPLILFRLRESGMMRVNLPY